MNKYVLSALLPFCSAALAEGGFWDQFVDYAFGPEEDVFYIQGGTAWH